jgi:hypothetical protein
MVDGVRSIHEVCEARLLIRCGNAVIYFLSFKIPNALLQSNLQDMSLDG